MNLFLNADYYYEPNLKEIRAYENEVRKRREKSLQNGPTCPDWAKGATSAFLTALSGDNHHVFDAHVIAIFRDRNWQVVGDGDFEAIVNDESQDYPVIYLRDWTTMFVGQTSKKHGDHKSSIEPSVWLEGFENEWGDSMLEVANKLFNPELEEKELPLTNLSDIPLFVNDVVSYYQKEHLVSVLYRMVWKKSMCWESGIDEGGFEIVETIFDI